jgi:hypothetical protein
MHDIAPILDIEIPVNSVDENLPTAVASLVMQASMEDRPLSECLEQKIAFLRGDLDDLVALRVHPRTSDLFRTEEANLWSLLNTLQFLVSDLRVHDKPSPANSAVRSTTRLSLVGGV